MSGESERHVCSGCQAQEDAEIDAVMKELHGTKRVRDKFVSDMTGQQLKAREVRQAHEEEIKYCRSMQVCDKMPIADCFANTGLAPVGVRQVDAQKKSGKFRSRLVAKEIKVYVAETPPLEALKFPIFNLACNEQYVMGHTDVPRAYLCGFGQAGLARDNSSRGS